MRTTRAAWTAITAAGLGLLVTGCGGGSEEPAEDPSAIAQAAPPPGMPGDPAAPGMPGDPAAPGMPGDPAAPGMPGDPAMPGGPAAPAAPAGDEAPKAAKAESGTDQLLALARTAAAEKKPNGPGAGGPNPGMPGMPGMPGDPAMDAMAGMPGDDPMGDAAYPGAEGMAPGLIGGPGLDMPGAEGMAGPGGPDSKAKEPDYGTPVKAAETFLDALKHRDIRILAETTALRAQYEAETARFREMFMALRSESLDPETLDELVLAFEDMKVVGMNKRKSTGSAGVIVGKREQSKFMTRTLTIRHEKDGWKVMDFSHIRVQQMPRGRYNRNNNTGNDSDGNASDAGNP